MKYRIFIYLLIFSITAVKAQNVSINADGSAPDNSAMLDVSSTTQGVLTPRMTMTQRDAITNPATGLLIYQTDADSGFYFNAGIPATPNWLKLTTTLDANPSTLVQDTDLDTRILTESVGGTDNDTISFQFGGTPVFEFDNSGRILLPGSNFNVHIGREVGDGNGQFGNVILGFAAFRDNQTSVNNVGLGTQVMDNKRTGNANTSIGAYSMRLSTSGFSNTALGYQAGRGSATDSLTGQYNLFIGREAGFGMSTGNNNVLLGYQAGYSLESGSDNVFLGHNAGRNETGSNLLYIENSISPTPLIYGNFAGDSVKIYGTLSIGDSTTFPTTRGTSGQVLQSNGAGQINWATISGDNLGNHTATANIQTGGNFISNDGDNEGLSVSSTGLITGTPSPTGAGNVAFFANGDFRTNGNGTGYYITNTQIGMTGNNSNSGDLRFKTGSTDRVYITSGGQVGINENTPGYRLDVAGTFSANSININDAFTFPNADGTNGQILTTDGSGTVSWQSAEDADLIIDADGNTQIQVEETVNDDIIRFDMNSTEYFRMDAGKLEIVNTGNSVFLGDSAGYNDDLSANINTLVGFAAGKTLTTGEENVLVGYRAGRDATGSYNVAIGGEALLSVGNNDQNTAVGDWAMRLSQGNLNVAIGAEALYQNTGDQNVAIGNFALNNSGGSSGSRNVAIGPGAGSDNSGSDNIFIGNLAGAGEGTISNRLYIDNAGTSTPLIYGDFAADSLRFNGIVEVASNLYVPSGNVGIGTTNPLAELMVESADTTNLYIIGNTNIDEEHIYFGYNGGSFLTGRIGLTSALDLRAANGRAIDFYTQGAQSGTGLDSATSVELAMSIAGDGNVGIGTFNPQSELHINNDDATSATLRITNSATASLGFWLQSNSSQAGIINYENTDLNFGTNGANRMTIENDGDVGIGTTTPNYLLDVNGTFSANSINVNDNYTFPTTAGTADQVLKYNSGGTALEWGTISGDGNGVYDGNGSLSTNSTITFGNADLNFDLTGLGKFEVQDNGLGVFQVDENGNSFFGGDVQWGDADVSGTVLATLSDVNDDGRFQVYENGVSSIDLNPSGSTVFNEQGLDRDFRVESDGEVNMLYVNAGTDGVGIGTASPNAPLQFANTTVNRKLVLFESTNNDHQFYGFGVNSSVLRYQTSGTTADHVFYAATSSSGSNELMRIEGTGNVGIGTDTPNQELDVEGDIEIDGNYGYESARTEYVSVSAAAFTPLQGVSGNISIQNVEIGGFESGNARWLAGGTTDDIGYMYAPVNLPHGAVVTEVTFYVYDLDIGAEIEGRLYRQVFGNTTVNAMATTGTTGVAAAPATTSITDNTISNATIDNSAYSYYLRVEMEENNNNLRVYGARITYTVTRVD